MSKYCSITTIALGLTIAFSVWAVGSMDASAQCMHSGHQPGGHAEHQPGGHADHQPGSGPDGGGMPMAQQCPHGGQMTIAGPLCFEVVYRPKETRVYLHGADHQPMSMRGVHGQMLMQVQGDDKVSRHPLTHVAPPAGSAGQDYLATTVDVSRVRDGNMTATFELANLPHARQPRTNFSQVLALSKLPVTVAALGQSDQPRIEQQKVCPVTGGRLGSMGPPVKVLVGDQPVYLCCKGCVAKVVDNPDRYLAKAAALRTKR